MAKVLITTDFDCTLCYLQTSSDVTTIHRNLPCNKFNASLVEYINVGHSALENRQYLIFVVWLIDEPIISNT